MTIISPLSNASEVSPRGQLIRLKWKQQNPPSHEFVAIACPEEEGGFSIFALNYPGVVSQGETLDEAKANIAEAFLAVLEARRKRGEEMQFSYNPPVEVPKNCNRLRVIVDA
jgi:predicted RNase H-like HicB family nuclease